ncbi:transglycosylase domain-containing protein [Aureimonas sp. D3]|uniref:transglycosylase domain-containing protein n=1 Tax=Aureimonas sp. D3 TaxID=1638164 RepID=UPI0007863393|nr:transglycosylase domain-containing protein [Aureimonas sp. D3]
MRFPKLASRRITIALSLALLGALLLIAIPGAGLVVSSSLPDVRQLDAMLDACQVTTVFEAEPRPGETGGKTDRLLCPDAVGPTGFSEALLSAVVASEDERFLGHRGVDDLAVLRSLLPGFPGGGSTITQQVARTLFLNDERLLGYAAPGKLLRKLREWHVALAIEALRDKRQILTIYLNIAPLGNGIIGFDPAARYYFGKPARDLDAMEAATLVGMLPQPMNRQPFKEDMAEAASAANAADRVLAKMLALGLVTPAEATAAQAKVTRVLRKGTLSRPPHETLLATLRPIEYRRVRDFAAVQLAERGLTGEATRIFLTLDPELQALADQATAKPPKDAEMAGVVLGPQAQVLAISGGTYSTSSWNPAWRANRSIGSIAKPLLYSLALEHAGDMPKTWSTAPLKGYNPAEPNGACRSGLTLETYLKYSCNRPFVSIAAREPALATQRVTAFGWHAPDNPLLIATGGVHSNPMDVALGYTAFRNGGRLLRPQVIVAATGTGGRLLTFEEPDEGRRVLAPDTANAVRAALFQPTSAGGSAAAARGRKHAAAVWGKTGTSDDDRDAWFVGSTVGWTAAILAWREAPGVGQMSGGGLSAVRFGRMVDAYWPDRNWTGMRDGRLRDGGAAVYGWWAHPQRLWNWLAAKATMVLAIALLAMALGLLTGHRSKAPTPPAEDPDPDSVREV